MIDYIWFLDIPRWSTDCGYDLTRAQANALDDLADGNINVLYWFAMAADHEGAPPASEILKWMQGPLAEILHENNRDFSRKQRPIPFRSIAFAEIVKAVVQGKLTSTMGKDVLRRVYQDEDVQAVLADPAYVLSDLLDEAIAAAIAAHPKQVEEFLNGSEKVLNWLVGQVMKALSGKANAAIVREKFITALGRKKDG